MTLHPELIREVRFPDGRTVIFLDRDATGLGAVRRGSVIDPGNLDGAVLHHTVSVLRDWDGDGMTRGDLDDVVGHLEELQRVRAADLGPEVPYSMVTYRHPDPLVGILAVGRGYDRSGAHTVDEKTGLKGLNYTRLGIAVAGNTSDDPITPGVEAAILWAMLWVPNLTLPTVDHSVYKATHCAGDSVRAAIPRLQPANVTALKESFAMAARKITQDLAEGTAPDWAVEAGVADLVPGITTGQTAGNGIPNRWEVLTYLARIRKELLAVVATEASLRAAGDASAGAHVDLAPIVARINALERQGITGELDVEAVVAAVAAELEGLEGNVVDAVRTAIATQ